MVKVFVFGCLDEWAAETVFTIFGGREMLTPEEAVNYQPEKSPRFVGEEKKIDKFLGENWTKNSTEVTYTLAPVAGGQYSEGNETNELIREIKGNYGEAWNVESSYDRQDGQFLITFSKKDANTDLSKETM